MNIDDINDDSDIFSMLLYGYVPKKAGRGQPVEKPVRVYRIELPNGNGPFNSDLPNAHEIYEEISKPEPGFDCSHLARLNHEQMGVTEEEFQEAHGPAAYACEDLKALRKWFPDPARDYLAQYGARVVVYEVPAGAHLAKIGHGEVLIARNECRRVETLDLKA